MTETRAPMDERSASLLAFAASGSEAANLATCWLAMDAGQRASLLSVARAIAGAGAVKAAFVAARAEARGVVA